MGRKRTHHDATRTKIVSARLKPETYDLISEHAEKLGLSRAGYIEHLIENRPLRLSRPLADDLSVPLLNELKRVGNNLNQIAHARNSGLDVDPRLFRTVVTEIIATICSNEVLRRRYETAEAEVAGKSVQFVEEEFRLRKAAAPAKAPEPSRSEPTGGAQGYPSRPSAPKGAPHFEARTPAEPHPMPGQRTDRAPPPPGRDLRLSEQDFALRLWPTASPGELRRQTSSHQSNDRKRDPAGRKNDPKTASSWFKLPWGLRLRSPRR